MFRQQRIAKFRKLFEICVLGEGAGGEKQQTANEIITNTDNVMRRATSTTKRLEKMS